MGELILASLVAINLVAMAYTMAYVSKLKGRFKEHEILTGILLMGLFDSPERAKAELAKLRKRVNEAECAQCDGGES